jgi:hypothetical protein
MTDPDYASLLGIAGAPLLVLALTAHLKPLLRATFSGIFDHPDPAWPLVADLVGVAWMVGGFYAGVIELPNVIVAVLAGLAVGVAAGRLRDEVVDRVPALRGERGEV